MDNNTKLSNLAYYLERGWPLVPCHWITDNGTCSCGKPKCKPGKHPIPRHGFNEATTDPAQIKAWHEKWPQANWGVRCGSKEDGGCGYVVIDIDPKNGGELTWEQLRNDHPEPIETVTVATGGGGKHLYFQYPEGHEIGSPTNVWPGIDCRANGGMVIIPPSVTTGRYSFELSPAEVPFQEIPEWILDKVDHQEKIAQEPPTQPLSDDQTASNTAMAISLLNALSNERADNYDQWLQVGMSLYDLGDQGLTLWDMWSQKSPKYEAGKCAEKWLTFSPALVGANFITFGSLIHWASEDGGAPFIKPAPVKPKPSDYQRTLEAFGYHFTVNAMNDMLYVNQLRLSDLLMSKIMTNLREYNYRAKDVAMDTIASMGLDHQFHPIKDYLLSLEWDGFDTIEILASMFTDRDKIFHQLIRKWLVGAVGRILGPRPGQQHPMLVLDGPQGIGKSRFAWWLGSPLPAFYIQNSINTMDKDFLILLCSKWIWEVEELGATLRKSDIESLKAFLSKEIINVRKPYGRDEIVKPATASFIGTINSSGGFLADPTGNRRFRVCTITEIDWDYDKIIDINQLWANAVHLFKQGETWELDPQTQAKITEINSRYEVDDPIAYDIFDHFLIDPSDTEHYTASAQIIHTLRTCGAIVGGSDQSIANRIGNVLQKLGCESGRIRINGQRVRAWQGVRLKA